MLALGIGVATLAAFLISALYYAIAPGGPSAGDGRSPGAAIQAITELLRSAVISALLAGLMSAGGWNEAGRGALLGLSLWAMPVVLLIGSIVHEATPPRTAALHAGDWLLKLVAIGIIIGAFT